jgi:hypothetical protein
VTNKTFEELSAPPPSWHIPQLCPLPAHAHPICTGTHTGNPVAHPLHPTSPVPEPSTIATMLIGLAAVAWLKRRRR